MFYSSLGKILYSGGISIKEITLKKADEFYVIFDQQNQQISRNQILTYSIKYLKLKNTTFLEWTPSPVKG